jgi:hypothetical protein
MKCDTQQGYKPDWHTVRVIMYTSSINCVGKLNFSLQLTKILICIGYILIYYLIVKFYMF